MHLSEAGLSILLLIFLVHFVAMEQEKTTQHAEIQLLRMQGKTVAEIHRELVHIHGGVALSLSTVRQ